MCDNLGAECLRGWQLLAQVGPQLIIAVWQLGFRDHWMFWSLAAVCRAALAPRMAPYAIALLASTTVQPASACHPLALCRSEGGVMVCTDAAARGIDIPFVTHVVQADFATDAIVYLHRVSQQPCRPFLSHIDSRSPWPCCAAGPVSQQQLFAG